MKIGDAVRVRITGQKRLERGVVVGSFRAGGDGPDIIKVALGLRTILVGKPNVTVIRKPHERDTVLAKVNSIRRAAADLTRDRGNKKLANRSH